MAAAATLSLSLGLVGHGLPVAHADERDDAQSQLNSANQKEAQLRSSLEGLDLLGFSQLSFSRSQLGVGVLGIQVGLAQLGIHAF